MMKLNAITQQDYVGAYKIIGDTEEEIIQFNFVKKPNYINRLFCKLLLGWTWVNFK